jgi:dihydrofolate synthase/folylpolyglutamate synthase
VPVEAVVQGLARARWPGRLQWIRERPGLLLDGAHNPAGTEALAGYLEAEQLKPTLVYGCLGDKDWPRMVQSLAPHVRQAIVVAPPSDRALDPRELGSAFARGGVVATVAADVPHALAIAKAQTSPDGVVLVAGSLYLIGDVLRVLGEAGV